MNLQERIELLSRLAKYLESNEAAWLYTKEKASRENAWFIPAFIDLACKNIAAQYLNKSQLQQMAADYSIPELPSHSLKIGIVMAGNIPLVGFHDFLMVFLSGHTAVIKMSSKDNVLIKHIIDQLYEWQPLLKKWIQIQDLLIGCDAYIATGSNNSARYFEHYFSKYPHIIRKNRTAVAVLNGNEKEAELEKIADDIHLYFGLGCRNVTHLCVPEKYDFLPLLKALEKYSYFINHNKYKNNYDYQLAVHLLSSNFYMTNGSILLIENDAIFSPISQINYSYYEQGKEPAALKTAADSIQCITGSGYLPFGQAQAPTLFQYADRVDTMQFLLNLKTSDK